MKYETEKITKSSTSYDIFDCLYTFSELIGIKNDWKVL